MKLGYIIYGLYIVFMITLFICFVVSYKYMSRDTKFKLILSFIMCSSALKFELFLAPLCIIYIVYDIVICYKEVKTNKSQFKEVSVKNNGE
ncbi:MAG: hypothetical protein EOM50_01725 [Erysipelotrichia bacterium]|nr:hypothetical protein [Erysipelotrichia bacterium]